MGCRWTKLMGAMIVIAGTGIILPAGNGEATAPTRLALGPCQVDGLSEASRCGTYEVWENRGAQAGRKISLSVVVVPATGEPVAPDPLFVLVGGPGEGAASIAGFMARGQDDIRRHRDLVFIDQRGTGKSNPLPCPLLGPRESLQTYLGDMYEEAYVRQCLELVKKKADPRFYTTSLTVDDLDDVRAALGYEKINLIGFSYGTRVAQEYMRRHGTRVRAAILVGPAPPSHTVPGDFAMDSQRALDALFAACAGEETCAMNFPYVAEHFQGLLERLRQGPVWVSLTNPFTRQNETVSLGYGPFVTAIRAMLYNVFKSSQIPLYIDQAHKGNWAPITLYAAYYQRGIAERIADGLYLSVTCAEDLPFLNVEAKTRASAGTFLGGYRIREQIRACGIWPRGDIPADFRSPLKSQHPVLIISGEVDPVTPPATGAAIAKHLPNGMHVVVPNAAHGMFGARACLTPLLTTFLEKGTTEGLDTSCVIIAERPPFETDPKKLVPW